MPVVPARSRRGAEDQHRLLTAAGARLICEQGIHSVNSNQIARAAGVGVGTFYAHFRDKHELLQVVVAGAVDALRLGIERAATAAGDDLLEQVRAMVEAIVSFAELDPDGFRLAARPQRSRSGTRRPSVGHSTRAAERRLAALQAAGQLDLALHPAVAARAFLSMQNGVVSWWLEDPGRATRSELVDTLVRLHPAIAGNTSDASDH